jgi:amino acid adenylation domain-containing protein
MKTTGELLAHLNGIQVKLWDEGGALRYSAPKGALTPDLLAELRSRKAEILALLTQARTSAAAPPLQPIARDGRLPLSFAQERLWFLHQLEARSAAYNISLAIRLSGPLNCATLEQSLSEIVRRHESLRTNFVAVAGEPGAVIHPPRAVTLPVVTVAPLPAGEQDAEIERLAHEQARRSFDLATDPLWRVSLLQLAAQPEEEHCLLLTISHIVFDGWSVGLFIQELTTLYAACAQEQPRPEGARLAALPIQYVDYASWQRHSLQGERLAQRLAYWKQQLAGAPALLQLPADRPRPAVQTLHGHTAHGTIPPALTQQLNNLILKSDETLFMVLLAAFKILLWRYSGQADLVVGAPSANRSRREIEPLLGLFVNTLVLRTDLSGNPTFRELLSRVRRVTMGAIEHQDAPFEKLVEKLQPARNLSHNSLFQVMFAMQNGASTITKAAGLTITSKILGSGAAMFDLTISVEETAAGLHCLWEYNTDLFDDATIQRMIGHFHTLLAGIAADPGQRIADLPLLTAAEGRQLLIEWNDTQRPSPHDRCIHQLIEAQVARTPDAVAVLFTNDKVARWQGDKVNRRNVVTSSSPHPVTLSLTYCELNERANQLAHHLQSLGVGPNTLVGLCMERSLEMVVAWLGTLKAGAAYVPLDPAYPQARLAWMVEDAKPAVLLTQERLVTDAPIGHLQSLLPDLQVVCLDADWERIAASPNANPGGESTPDATAYVIYTSGSTGRPKGVPVPHRGLGNVVAAQQQMFGLGVGDRILQLASLSFDAATFEILMALGVGATLCLAPHEQLLPGPGLSATLHELHITQITITPTALAALPVTPLPDLHTICVAGEACSADLAARWRGGRRFFNLYGPTEATIWVSAALCTDGGKPPPIGRPIANTQLYILDAYGNPVPIGVAGELHIGGVGVVRGYLHQPELTREKFIDFGFSISDFGLEESDDSQNPKSKILNPKLYKTGDLARYLPDGNIEFLGRIDHQVKIRGFRIELGEIETALLECPGVQACAVVVREDHVQEAPASGRGDKRLVAYVVGEVARGELRVAEGEDSQPATRPLQPATLRDFLRQKLPNHMIPSVFVMLDALPLSPNGKIDSRALPEPMTLAAVPGIDGAAQTATETALAAVWAELLGVPQVGRHDNFFDLGGHSLLATRLIYRVQEIFAVSLSVHQLFSGPTVAEVATAIERMRQADRAVPGVLMGERPHALVPLQPQGNQRPFFLTPPVMGVVFPYYDLARLLGRDQPVYGLQAVGVAGEAAPLPSVEALAAYYLNLIREVQPEGPYLLGGWSFGAHIAYEMAQQLQRAGDHVGLLTLIDTPPLVADKLARLRTSLEFLVTSALPFIWPYVYDYLHLHFKEVTRPAKGIGERRWPDMALARSLLTSLLHGSWDDTQANEGGQPNLLSLLRVFLSNLQATNAYTAQPYAGSLTLVRTGQAFGRHGQSPDLGWRSLAMGGVSIYRTPGHHLDLLKQPNVQVLAGRLRALLKASHQSDE